MATLKDLIKTETLKVGSHAASPSEKGVIVLSDGTSIGTWGSIYSGVAPTDGFVAVNAKSANTAAACVIDNTNGYSVGKLWGKAGAKIGLTLPFARGTKISVNGNDLSEITVRFIKSIGGGYKRYLEALSCNRFGGLLCLRLKTIYAVSESKSSTLGCRTTVAKLLYRKALLNTLHRRTVLRSSVISSPLIALCLFKSWTAVTTSCSSGILSRMLWGTHGGIQDLSGCLKGKSSTLKCSLGVQEHLKRQKFVSTLTSANNHYMEVAA